MSEPSKRYRAFISYSQKDKAHARRLHEALEHYRLPNRVEAAGVDAKARKLGRFFRDDEEMGAATDLGAALQGAIADAENLIVVCSPNAAQSKWVNEEIIHFKRTDRADNIFAVVVAGTPHSADEQECFPPALRFALGKDGALSDERAEPLAVDLRKERFARVLTRLVAGLAQIPFDALWKREQRRAAARAMTLSLTVFFIAILVGGALTQSVWYPKAQAYWRYTRHAHSTEDLMAAAPGSTFQDCREGSADCPVMVVIPEGTFLMGSPESPNREVLEAPQREISVARFAVSQTEITFAHWRACVAGGGCRSQPNPITRNAENDNNWAADDRPVIGVSWNHAQEYVAWLTAMTGHEYRLLTEAEWEYAERGITTADDPRNGELWSFGNDQNQLDDYAWYYVGLDQQTHPVGTKRANPFGLYDMHGNVHEWVQDCFAMYDPSKLDSSAVGLEADAFADSGGDTRYCDRAYRGGSFTSHAEQTRSAYRWSGSPNERSGIVGFRIARTLGREDAAPHSAPQATRAPVPPGVSTSTAPSSVEELASPRADSIEPTDTTSRVSSDPDAPITSPTWLERPTADQIMQLYPEGAIEAGVEARIMLDCWVRSDGRLSCTIESVEATDYVTEFGEAALDLSMLFKMAPTTADGTPTAGRRYRMPVAMRMN